MASPVDAAPQFELQPPAPSRLPVVSAAVVGLAVLGGVVWLALHPPPAPRAERLPPLTREAQAYLPQLEITTLEVSRWENFLGQEVVYLDLRLANRGPRSLAALELTVDFEKAAGQPVHTEAVRAVSLPGVRQRQRLGPHQTITYRAAFDSVPSEWNQLPPRIRVTGLVLE